MEIRKNKERKLLLSCTVENGEVIQDDIKLKVKELYTKPNFNSESILSVVITTLIFEDEYFIEELRQLLIYLLEDCNRNNYNNFLVFKEF